MMIGSSAARVFPVVIAALVAIHTSTLAVAQTTLPTSDVEDHPALRALVPEYERAVNDFNPALLLPHLDPEFSGVMVTGDNVSDLGSIESYWKKLRGLLGEDGHYRVKVNVSAPALIANNLAVATGTTDDVVDARGKTYRFNSSWTVVCRKTAGEWKLLRLQAAMDPVNNPFVTASVAQARISFGAIGAVAGLLVGSVIGAVIASRRTRSTHAVNRP